MKSETILTNPTESELANAVQENLFALFRAMVETLPGGEIVQTEQLGHHLAFPTNPMFKGVWRARLSDDESDAVIDETIAWFRARNAPYFFWWTGPGTTPNDLGERLQARGLLDMAEQQQELAAGIHQTEQGAPGMVADLHQVDESLLAKTPPGFVIKEVAHENELYDFKNVFVETYEIPDWAGQAWVDATLRVGIGATPWQMYIGYLNGEPVATSMLFNGAGVASVYAVASVPSAQRKGIGAAITLKPLVDAREMGYHFGVLFSTEMGVPVYQRIGFRLTGARINRYLWRNN
jgi:GNAT superfamily N-acetyltransferase